MYFFKDIIDQIENDISGNIDVSRLAKMSGMSVYEFRRIFTFVTKISLGEYVRKRRLSLAALELYENKESVADISAKYGYDSPSSFSRAFKEFHGISPSDVLKGNHNFHLITKIKTEITSVGGEDITYTISKKPAFTISGFYGKSDMTDTECCENVWSDFYNSEYAEKISDVSDKIYAVYNNDEDCVGCHLGIPGEHFPRKVNIPESEWTCFKLVGTDDSYVNGFYKNILNQWLSSSGYTKNDSVPNIEVFPSDMSNDSFEWEIWIPISKEN